MAYGWIVSLPADSAKEEDEDATLPPTVSREG
jgi:hypothetical protein